MAGYIRQSSADIVPTAVVRATPINNEFNTLRDAFAQASGHKHDGTTAEGAYIPLISGTNNRNKVVIDSTNNRVSFYVNVSSTAVEQLRVQDGAILPVTNNDIDLGSATYQFKDLHIDGTANIDSLVADTAAISGGTANGVAITAGTINNTPIGVTTANAITGTVITANTGFTGNLTGNVTGNLTGNSAGTHTGAVIGNVTGNVVSSGSSTFNNVTISGTLNMDGATSATIENLATPVNTGDAATKGYVDTADALKLNLSGGTMSGAIAMGTNKITGVGDPTSNQDAATKIYVDTSISNLVDSAPGTLDTLNEIAAALGDDPNFATTITNSIATKLPLAGGTMTGAIAMGTNKITGVGDPTLAQDAATKTYVDTADATKLNLSGGTMTGDIAMSSNKITGLGTPTSTGDAATKSYVDTADATKLNLSGGTMTGNIVMGANKVTSTATPTANEDLTTKTYVDSILGSATAAATSAAAAATSETNAANSVIYATQWATVAANAASAAAASYDSFDDRYLGAKSSAPSVDNDGNALLTGALYYDTTAEEMRVYTGTGWTAAGSAVNGTSSRQVYTATSGQTTFSITYDVGYVDVYLNGVKLVVGTDFTATSGVNIVLTTGATTGDIVDIVAYGAFNVANTYTQAAADAKFLQVLNDLSDLNDAATARTNLGLVIGTDVQAYDADTAKLDVAQTFTAQQTFTEIAETVYSLTGTDIDPANGTVQYKTLAANTTFTESLADGQSVVLLIEGGATYTVTWPTMTWTSVGGNVAPTLTASDTLVLWKIGATLYGAYAGSQVTP